MNENIKMKISEVLRVTLKGILVVALSSTFAIAAPAKKTDSIPAYHLGPGDVLTVAVWKEEGLQQEVLIRPDGGMSFPLAGDIQAGGKTVNELQNIIAKKIKRYIPDPVVSIAVRKVENNKIFVIGKVNRPGEFVASHYVDVMQALAMAGGLNAFASSNNIKILRRVNAGVRSMSFEYDEVANGKELQQNIILKSGDVVVVP